MICRIYRAGMKNLRCIIVELVLGCFCKKDSGLVCNRHFGVRTSRAWVLLSWVSKEGGRVLKKMLRCEALKTRNMVMPLGRKTQTAHSRCVGVYTERHGLVLAIDLEII